MNLAAFFLVVMTGKASLKRFMVNKPKIKINSQTLMNQTVILKRTQMIKLESPG